MSPAPTKVAYLHGFASSAKSIKGEALRKKLGDVVALPDLNRPSFEDITVTAALEAMDQLHEECGRPRWKLVGSSMGGHIAAVRSVHSIALAPLIWHNSVLPPAP